LIIRELRIAKAGVFFPMPESRVLDPSFGSRHRAALGITEETDAVVVVVSEERGTISFCFNGNIVSNLDGPGLRRALEGVFSPRRRRAKGTSKREPASQRLGTEPPVLVSRGVETARSRAEPARALADDQDSTLVSVPAEPGDGQTTRIRNTEPEIEPSPPSQPPPTPLRRKHEKPDPSEKTEGDGGRATMTGAARGQRLTTPMRSPSSSLASRTPTPEPYGPPASDDDRNTDSNDGNAK
jgi:hypothetical protein